MTNQLVKGQTGQEKYLDRSKSGKDLSDLNPQRNPDGLKSERNPDGLKNGFTDTNGISGVKGKQKDDKALKEACQGFEAIFLNTMLKSMRSTIPDDPLLGKSQGMDIYTSMHDQYLAEKISRGENSTGIGEYLYRQLQDAL
ncbi:MAG: rod-binding protein [Desulfamplus sp.]|nr:rod-binding protein [Desulfamplus sp.]